MTYRNNKTLFSQLILENIEQERRRISMEIHDSICQDILYLGNLETSEPAIKKAVIENTLNNIRRICLNLYPPMFENIGFCFSLEQMIINFKKQYPIFIYSEIQYNKSLSSASELHLFRIIQEALNNVIKHSKADAVKIIITETCECISLLIWDNGIGFNYKIALAASHSFGLKNIAERINILGGKIGVSSNSHGSKMSIIIPHLKNQ